MQHPVYEKCEYSINIRIIYRKDQNDRFIMYHRYFIASNVFPFLRKITIKNPFPRVMYFWYNFHSYLFDTSSTQCWIENFSIIIPFTDTHIPQLCTHEGKKDIDFGLLFAKRVGSKNQFVARPASNKHRVFVYGLRSPITISADRSNLLPHLAPSPRSVDSFFTIGIGKLSRDESHRWFQSPDLWKSPGRSLTFSRAHSKFRSG